MKEIDTAVDAGVFGEIVWANQSNIRQRFILGARLYQDISDESEGFRANLNARYWQPVAKPVDLTVSVGATYQDDDFTDHYFGVNTLNVGTSGLPLFDAEGGMNEYYAVVGATIYMSQNWVLGLGVRGSSLAGDAKDSPIVDDRGDSTQWMGGMGVGYAF